MINQDNVKIRTLGPCTVPSPLPLSRQFGDGVGNFVPDSARIRYDIDLGLGDEEHPDIFFEKAGPREKIHFKPERVRAAMVTCGGLCPGLNNVIHSIVRQLDKYGVQRIFGMRYGYQGMNPEIGMPPIPLDIDVVDDIQREGGTILGSSRGPQNSCVMVNYLQQLGVNLLFCIGGDGTQRGAHDIADEIARQQLPIAVIGIPKTIDNDIMYTSRSFGFHTAIDAARTIIDCAHTEARGAPYGVGLVKLMGRESGFIAAHASIANQNVNFCLVPEVPFTLEGSAGFLPLLEKRLRRRRHAVIVVAEGAGQELLDDDLSDLDPSGNRKLKDIGIFLKQAIKDYFAVRSFPMSIKYIDPSYIIRSIPANSDDAFLCDQLARHAVHAAMAGKTDALIGLWNDAFIHVPIPLAVARKKKVEPESELWVSVYESTDQPLLFQ